MNKEILIKPVFNQAVKAQHGSRQRLQFIGNRRAVSGRLRERSVVYSMGCQVRLAVVGA